MLSLAEELDHAVVLEHGLSCPDYWKEKHRK